MHELSIWIFKEEVISNEAFVADMPKTWIETGISILSNGWKDINFLANNPYDTNFLKSTDAYDGVKDINMLFKLIDDVVDEVREEHVVQALTDNTLDHNATERK